MLPLLLLMSNCDGRTAAEKARSDAALAAAKAEHAKLLISHPYMRKTERQKQATAAGGQVYDSLPSGPLRHSLPLLCNGSTESQRCFTSHSSNW
jgi:hypothetical protein